MKILLIVVFIFDDVIAKGGIVKSKCDVCGRSPKGYTSRCKACSFQMHPGCAMLPLSLSFPSLHHHSLRLLPSSSAANTTGGDYSGDATGFLCGECKKGKRAGRVYRCTVCDYHLHAVCAKDAAVNGLRENGHKGRDKSPAVLGTAARLASQVVFDFLGGIMEGLGEGVGEAILDGVTRGGGGGAVAAEMEVLLGQFHVSEKGVYRIFSKLIMSVYNLYIWRLLFMR